LHSYLCIARATFAGDAKSGYEIARIQGVGWHRARKRARHSTRFELREVHGECAAARGARSIAATNQRLCGGRGVLISQKQNGQAAARPSTWVVPRYFGGCVGIIVCVCGFGIAGVAGMAGVAGVAGPSWLPGVAGIAGVAGVAGVAALGLRAAGFAWSVPWPFSSPCEFMRVTARSSPVGRLAGLAVASAAQSAANAVHAASKAIRFIGRSLKIGWIRRRPANRCCLLVRRFYASNPRFDSRACHSAQRNIVRNG
jgi:hypothetical protein